MKWLGPVRPPDQAMSGSNCTTPPRRCSILPDGLSSSETSIVHLGEGARRHDRSPHATSRSGRVSSAREDGRRRGVRHLRRHPLQGLAVQYRSRDPARQPAGRDRRSPPGGRWMAGRHVRRRRRSLRHAGAHRSALHRLDRDIERRYSSQRSRRLRPAAERDAEGREFRHLRRAPRTAHRPGIGLRRRPPRP